MFATFALATPLLVSLFAAAPLEQSELIRRALEQDSGLARARAALEAAQEAEDAAGRWLQDNPELEFAGQLSSPFGGEEQEFETLLVQPLEVAGQGGLRRAAARERTRLARLELGLQEAAVRARAMQAHVDLYAAQERHRLSGQLSALAQSAAELAPRRVAKGDLSPVDATLVAAEFLRFAAQEQQALQSLRQAQTVLASWLLSVPVTEVTAAAPPAAAPPEQLPEVEPQALAALEAGEAQLRAATGERRLLDREAFPDPTLGVGYKRVELGVAGVEPAQLLLLKLVFPLPLFDRGQAERALARAEERARQSELDSLRRTLPHEVRAARERLLRAQRLEQASVALRPELRRAFETVQAAFTQGQLGWSDYQLKRNALVEAELDTIEAVRERVSAAAEYQRLLVRYEEP